MKIPSLFEEMYSKYNFDAHKLLDLNKTLTLPLLHAQSGKTVFFSTYPKDYREQKEDVSFRELNSENLCPILEAASAVPLLYDRAVHVNGEWYSDGSFKEPFTLDLPVTQNTRKILILNITEEEEKKRSEGFVVKILCKLRELNHNKKYSAESSVKREIVYTVFSKEAEVFKERMKEARKLEKEGKLLILRPKKNLHPVYDLRISSVRKSLKKGEETVFSNKEKIEDFLGFELNENSQFKKYKF
jgi:predicted patatin/cPLA2 family phospholipase